MALYNQSNLLRDLKKSSESQDTFFSIYQSESAIELRSGCNDYHHLRLISSCLSYEQAQEIAERMSEYKQLPLKDLVQ